MNIKLIVRSFILFSVCSVANASFHTFDISEVYSDSTGTIQFIELVEAFGVNNQHLFSGRGLRMSDGGSTNTLIFGSDLPSSATANQRVLIATAGYAALAGVPAPDYIMADNFLFITGGTLGFGSSSSFGTDTFTFGSLPTDGLSSLSADGSIGINSPTNFAGETGSITVVPVPAAAWLFGSGLMVMFGFSKRKV